MSFSFSRRFLKTALPVCLCATALLSGCGGGGSSLGNRLGLGLSSIGSTTPTPSPTLPRVPLAQYVGTWSGPWTDPQYASSNGAHGQTGTLTLQVAANGQVTGQIVDATTGQTGTVSAALDVQNGETTGYLANQSCTLNGQTNASSYSMPEDAAGHWQGAFTIPFRAEDAGSSSPPPTVTVAGYDLTKN